MNLSVAKRFIVSGKVQGVFFRASTRQQAVQLNIRGYAKNLPNGSVEVVAIGSIDAIAVLEKWLSQGPPSARVDTVQISIHHDVDVKSHTDFISL